MRPILLTVGLLFAASIAGANTLSVSDYEAAWTRFDKEDGSYVGTPQTAVTTYDGRGHAIKRVFLSNGSQQTQTLTWDGAGRLTAVSQRDQTSGDGYDWTALYDGLGRRLRTVYTPVDGGVACPKLSVTQESWYDPEVEFLELGVSVNGQKHWKMYGPDLDGVYGGLQGIGGLEAVIKQSDGVVTPVVNDAFGNAVASVTNSTVVVWNPTRVGGYGPLPGSSAAWFSTNTTLAAATVWRGKRMDPTGYYWQGARYYDPVGGRFLSPDPLGHEASMDLYSYANGDPINGCDPDGRFGKNSSSSRLDDSWSQGMIQGYNRELRAEDDARASRFQQSFGPSPWEAFAQQMERELNLQAYWDATTPPVHDPFGNFAAGVIRTAVDATGFGAVGTFMHDAYTGQQWLTGAPVSEGQAAFNMLASIGTMPLMMGGAMRPAANVMTRAATRIETGLVGRSFIPQLERVAGKTATQLEFDFVKDIRPVLFKGSAYKPSLLRPGEFKLHLPDLRSDILNWEQNLNELSRFTERGISFRETTPLESGGWLQRERNHLHYLLGYERVVTKHGVFWMPRR